MGALPEVLDVNLNEGLIEEIEEDNLPIATDIAFDFKNKNFILDDTGEPLKVIQNEAVKVWIYKALATKRGAHSAYSHQFGNDLEGLFGEVLPKDFKKSEIERCITEALMVNPYIKSIDKIDIEQQRDILTAQVQIRTIYNDKVVSVSAEL